MHYSCPNDPTHTDFHTEAKALLAIRINQHGDYEEELNTLELDYVGAVTCAECGAVAETEDI